MRAFRYLAVTLLALSLPLVAFAQTASSPTATSLLAELQALEQQIAALTGAQSAATSSSVTASTAPANPAMCPDLYRTLSYGASGSDVTSLQTYLAAQGFFSASATGYFGSITQAAVGAWQEAEGVVSGGDASSTGLGVVGPKTRAAIANECGGQVEPSSCLPVQPPAAECPTGWQPVSDTNGCTEYYQCTISLPTVQTSTSSTPLEPVQVGATTSCAVVQQPVCSGTVTPFQTDSNGCVTAYECVL